MILTCYLKWSSKHWHSQVELVGWHDQTADCFNRVLDCFIRVYRFLSQSQSITNFQKPSLYELDGYVPIQAHPWVHHQFQVSVNQPIAVVRWQSRCIIINFIMNLNYETGTGCWKTTLLCQDYACCFYAIGMQKYIGIISTSLPTVQQNRSIVIQLSDISSILQACGYYALEFCILCSNSAPYVNHVFLHKFNISFLLSAS